MLALLCGPSGATIATVTRSTGWQPHTVRAFLTAVVRKKLGLRLESEKTDGERVYRIVAGKTARSFGALSEPVPLAHLPMRSNETRTYPAETRRKLSL